MFSELTIEKKVIKYFGAFICNSLTYNNIYCINNFSVIPKKRASQFDKILNTYINNTEIDYLSELDLIKKVCEFYSLKESRKFIIKNFLVGEEFSIINFKIVETYEIINQINTINNFFYKNILEIDKSNVTIKFCSTNNKTPKKAKPNSPENIPKLLNILQTKNKDEILNQIFKINPAYKGDLKIFITPEIIKEFELFCEAKINEVNLIIKEFHQKINDKRKFKKSLCLLANNIKFVELYTLRPVEVDSNEINMNLDGLNIYANVDENKIDFKVSESFKIDLNILETIISYQDELEKCFTFSHSINKIKETSEFKKIVRGIKQIFYNKELEKYFKDEVNNTKINLHEKVIISTSEKIYFNEEIYSNYEKVIMKNVLNKLNLYIQKVNSIINTENILSILIPDEVNRIIFELIKDVSNKGINTYIDALKGIENKSLNGYNIKQNPAWELLKEFTKEKIKDKLKELVEQDILNEVEKKASFGYYTAVIVNPEIITSLKEYEKLKISLIERNNGVLPTRTCKMLKSVNLENILLNIEKGFVLPKDVRLKNNLSLRKLIKIVNILETQIFFSKELWVSISPKLDKFPEEFIIYLKFKQKATTNEILKKNLEIIINEELSKCQIN